MSQRGSLPPRGHAALGVLLLVAALPAAGLRAQNAGDTLTLYHRGLVAPVDPNGYLRDPRWLGGAAAGPDAVGRSRPPDIDRRCRFRAATGNLGARYLLTTRGPCLSADELRLVTLNETASSLGSGFVCTANSLIGDIHGHVNWFPVTATGQLRWAGYSALPGDEDFSFDLGNTPEPNALTSGNPRPAVLGGRPAYRVEFNYRESLRRLVADGADEARAWWAAFGADLGRATGAATADRNWWVALADTHENAAAMRGLVDGRIAVVTGLFGLDAVHDFQSELHPAYAMFVLVDTARTSLGLREEWAFLVRNLGNEGECSAGRLPLLTAPADRSPFTVDLGTWAGAGAPRVSLGPAWSTDTTAVPAVVRDTAGGHLLVSIRMPRPSADGRDFLAFGTLWVVWPRDGAGSPLTRFYDGHRPWLARRGVPVNLTAVGRRRPPSRRRIAGPGDFLEPPGARPQPFQSVLVPMRPRDLTVADSAWSPPRAVAAGRSIPLFEWTPVTRGCGLEGADPICGTPVQLFTLGMDSFDDFFFSPLYVYARVVRVCNDECFLGKVLGALAYRVDVSGDRFRHRCVALPCFPSTVPGWSLRLSPILAGSAVRLGGGASLIPYTLSSLGVSFLVGRRAAPLVAVGIGLRLHTGYFDLFVEGQDDVRMAGGFENRWAFPVGVYLNFANLLR